MDQYTSAHQRRSMATEGSCTSSSILTRCRTSLARGKIDAFTFIELIVTIAIIGVLAGIAAPMYADFKYTTQVTTAQAILREIESGVNMYYYKYGTYPLSLSDCMQQVPLDPWGNPYVYLSSQDPNWSSQYRTDLDFQPLNSDFDLYSMGVDGQTQRSIAAITSKDDILRAGNGSFVDMAAKFFP
jgi:general secretion pathway protein G